MEEKNSELKEKIEITVEEHERLIERSIKLDCLECAGVDNWNGFDYAVEMYEEDGREW